MFFVRLHREYSTSLALWKHIVIIALIKLIYVVFPQS